jgi:hypothetical protein
MVKGICKLSVIPMRLEPADTAEMVNQVLFGESYDVLEQRKKWIRIRLHHDRYEGWIDRIQSCFMDDKQAAKRAKAKLSISSDLIEIVSQKNGGSYFPIFLGSLLPSFDKNQNFVLAEEEFHFSGPVISKKQAREQLIEIAFQYLHAPYLWGGRTPAGIDCSGFTQMVYRLVGQAIPRDASQQAGLGETLSFIEESEPGDLAFFDNKEGHIVHVGIILRDNYILHASGKVRLDRLDQSGIFNGEIKRHTHKLRVIKKII